MNQEERYKKKKEREFRINGEVKKREERTVMKIGITELDDEQ